MNVLDAEAKGKGKKEEKEGKIEKKENKGGGE